MKRRIDRRPVSLTGPPTDDYAVGYAKPPVHTRFRKGQSGNPRGRPKGAKGQAMPASDERLKEIVLEEAYRTIGVRDGSREVKVPMAQAIVRAMAVNAVKGQQRAQRLFTELLTSIEREKHRERWIALETVFDYKVNWDRELERRRALGIVAPDPVPHPDHIGIDIHTGDFRILGPLTKEDKADLEVWQGYRQRFVDARDQLARIIAESTGAHEVVSTCDCDGPCDCEGELWSIEQLQEERGRYQTCIDIVDRMTATGRPLPLPDLPEDVEIDLTSGVE